MQRCMNNPFVELNLNHVQNCHSIVRTMRGKVVVPQCRLWFNTVVVCVGATNTALLLVSLYLLPLLLKNPWTSLWMFPKAWEIHYRWSVSCDPLLVTYKAHQKRLFQSFSSTWFSAVSRSTQCLTTVCSVRDKVLLNDRFLSVPQVLRVFQ